MSYWKTTGLKRLWDALVGDGSPSAAHAKVMLALDCSHTTAVSFAKGDSPVDPDELLALCRKANVSVAYVIGETDEPGPFREPNSRRRAVANGA
jgi:hypothetical protein